jgi:dCTP deaminase
MILSNRDIVEAIAAGDIVIDPPPHLDTRLPPFNTTAVDLRLAPKITVPRSLPVAQRIDRSYDPDFITRNSEEHIATPARPFVLEPNQFVLAHTIEEIGLPIRRGRPVYAARVEGKSSRARLGMTVHLSAPTVHSGFVGTITLEVANFGPNSIQLVPDVYICQLIFECVTSMPDEAPNQFSGQTTPAGKRAA